MSPAPTPKRPMIAAMKGVQAPGIIPRSEIIMIKAPVKKPTAGPKTKPLMNVKVSVNPTLIRMPNIGLGISSASVPKTIRVAAPIAIKADIKQISRELI